MPDQGVKQGIPASGKCARIGACQGLNNLVYVAQNGSRGSSSGDGRMAAAISDPSCPVGQFCRGAPAPCINTPADGKSGAGGEASGWSPAP